MIFLSLSYIISNFKIDRLNRRNRRRKDKLLLFEMGKCSIMVITPIAFGAKGALKVSAYKGSHPCYCVYCGDALG